MGSSKIYDIWDVFNFEIVTFQFLEREFSRSLPFLWFMYFVTDFARVCSSVIINFAKHFRHTELIVKDNIGLKNLLLHDMSEPVFYGDLVYV